MFDSEIDYLFSAPIGVDEGIIMVCLADNGLDGNRYPARLVVEAGVSAWRMVKPQPDPISYASEHLACARMPRAVVCPYVGGIPRGPLR